MIQVSISATDMEVLQKERYTHPHPRVQRKLHALYWVGLGLPRHVVARMVGVSEGTLRNDLHAYEQGGLEAFRPCNPHPTSAALHAYTDTIRQTFIAEPPHTVQEAIERIEALTGIRRSPTAVRTWLKKTGLAFGKRGLSRPKPTPSRSDASWRLRESRFSQKPRPRPGMGFLSMPPTSSSEPG